MTFTKYLSLGVFALAAIGAPSEARPVSYPGGWTVMQMNNGDASSLHAHYSPTARDSVGVYVERNWAEDFQFSGVQYNRLLQRWNGPGSQANLYAKVAGGVADPFGEGGARASGFVAVAADWETRRWFTSYESRAGEFAGNASVTHAARIGVAPYIGDYGDLHTWLMVQVNSRPEAETPTTVTPLIRFFKGIQMLELGYTPQEEELLVNWIVRF